MSRYCDYCGTLLDEDDEIEESTGRRHYVSACREYVHGALRASKREAERLRLALREIAVGRTSVDNDGPLDPFTSMAGRFLSIAQDALRTTAAKPNE